MHTPAPRNRQFDKVCWVVPDLHAAIQTWVRSMGAGPFFLFDNVRFENAVYRGKPAPPFDIQAAFTQAGNLQVELVCQRDDQPSFFRDVVPAGRSGFHHLALYCSDYDADFAAYAGAGATVAFSATMLGARNCWLEVPGLPFMVELLELNEAAAGVFETIRRAAENWDGQDPIRSFS